MLANYAKVALRNLRRNKVFATLSTLGLGLSIACCILIFLLVQHHMSVDRFHAKADRTVAIVTEATGEINMRESNVPYPMGAALRQEYAFLEKAAMVSSRQNSLVTLTEPGKAPVKFKEMETRAFAEPELFDIFDFPLVSGSFEAFKQPNTVLLTEKIARKYYGTTDALGKSIRVNNKADYQVVGILKDLPENTDLRYQIYCSWATLTADPEAKRMLNNWGGIHGGTQCFAVLRDGHDRAELENAFVSFREKYFHPEVREFYYHAAPLTAVHFDPDLGTGIRQSYVWALALIGLFLLLTACVNFVNMATAQALARAREVGVRKAIGSTQGQLFWQFMSETGLIVLFATGLGLLLAYLSVPALTNLIGTQLSLKTQNGLVFYSFLAILMLTVSFLSGAYPGLALSRFRPAESLKGSVDKQEIGGFNLRRVLVGSQFAISQMLIIGAVTVTAQMEYTRNADLGFRREGLVTLPLPGNYDRVKQKTLQQELGQVPGVEKVSLCFQPPASDANWNTRIRLDGRSQSENWETNMKFQDEHYLEAFDLQLVAGRNLMPSDTARELLVNEEMVRKLGLAGPEDIIGKRIFEGRTGLPVVGVVKNFNNRSFHDPILPQLMMTAADNYSVCALRLQLASQQSALAAIEKIWTTHFPEYYFECEFMDARLAKFYEQEQIIMQLLRLFAGIAVFIGCLGLYGLATFLLVRKRKEVGIRKTLGASVLNILWLFGREYLQLLLLAFVLATPLAWWAMHQWLDQYAFHIKIGAGIFGASLFLTFLIAGATVGIQSVRASLVNPGKSLRSE